MPIVEARGLNKSYGRRQVLHHIDLTVEDGECVGILGPNGSGKTTTVECIAGLRRRDSGDVTVLGTEPEREEPVLRAKLGIQLQSTTLPALMRVRQAVELFAAFYPDPYPPVALIDALGLGDHAEARFGTLSGGQQQRVGAALALVGRPELAVLDEMTAGLDPAARRQIWELLDDLRTQGLSILLVSHSMEEVERLCDRVVVIKEGRMILEGSPDQLSGVARQRMRFAPSGPFDHRQLVQLDSVDSVEKTDGGLLLYGAGSMVGDVVALLSQHDVSAQDLRIENESLEESYLDAVHGGRRL